MGKYYQVNDYQHVSVLLHFKFESHADIPLKIIFEKLCFYSFVMFNNYRIPKDNLLNKIGDVDDNGNYITPYKDPNKRHGASFGALSAGRVGITNICAIYATKGITIALRYAAVRKQFGPEGQEEFPILEYQSHVIPYFYLFYLFNNCSLIAISINTPPS